MTEEEWVASTDPTPMLEFLRGKVSDRKLRLFACDCCRRHSYLLVPETLAALEVAERFADGRADASERKRARESALHAGWCRDPATAHRRGPAKACVAAALARPAHEAASRADHLARHIGVLEKRDWSTNAYETTEYGKRLVDWSSGRREQSARQAGVLREVFGPLPFRTVPVAPSWRTATVLTLARQMYEDREFTLMPILADALQDAGCDNEEMLTHCRAESAHVRGCWVVDLLFDKG